MNGRPTVAAVVVLLLTLLLLTADAARVSQHISTATAVAPSTPTGELNS